MNDCGLRVSMSASSEEPEPSTAAQTSLPNETTSQRRKRYFAICRNRVWAPLIYPFSVLVIYYIVGIIFILFGSVVISTSLSSLDCVKTYQVNTTTIQLTINSSHCNINTNKISPPIFVYYEIRNLFESHRDYMSSYSQNQLAGVDVNSSEVIEQCAPVSRDRTGKIMYPCGMIADHVFNDTFTLFEDKKGVLVIDTSAGVIVWPGDLRLYKHRYDINHVTTHDWLDRNIFPQGIETSHFMVWMRTAPFPNFRKLYGKITAPETIEFPITITIANRYNATSFKGTKAIALTKPIWIGGPNIELGVVFLVLGIISFCMAIIFSICPVKSLCGLPKGPICSFKCYHLD